MSIFLNVLRPYVAYITFPVALVFGFVGYKIEGWVSDKYTPYNKSIQELRRERQEKEGKAELVIPKTIFEKNLSPSLIEEDPRTTKSNAA
ncbi:small integral membrane protein 12 [Neocloeon triangulifer]|uniref:small integral membrane protein 12 n=1 Tax=Neocloeon triangulifer TaxID=2078957 RepID=UPI00286F67BB|nr:small integral membrane protein 12 [Neocloeon triangulifer]